MARGDRHLPRRASLPRRPRAGQVRRLGHGPRLGGLALAPHRRGHDGEQRAPRACARGASRLQLAEAVELRLVARADGRAEAGRLPSGAATPSTSASVRPASRAAKSSASDSSENPRSWRRRMADTRLDVVVPVEAGAAAELGVGEQAQCLEGPDAPGRGAGGRGQLVDGQAWAWPAFDKYDMNLCNIKYCRYERKRGGGHAAEPGRGGIDVGPGQEVLGLQGRPALRPGCRGGRARPDRLRARPDHRELRRRDPAGAAHLHHHRRPGRRGTDLHR